MASRPVFVPLKSGPLYAQVSVEFQWSAGMAPSQKRKNVVALHAAAAKRNLSPLLEISTKSESELGRSLSAFLLSFKVAGRSTTVECAYQGSKVFERGGPFVDLIEGDSRAAKHDARLKSSGQLVGFSLDGEEFPLFPPTAFYDWLYINALDRHHEFNETLLSCAGFTDIEFNPERSINCQARACAIFVSLTKRDELGNALDSFREFSRYILHSHSSV